MPGVNFSRPLLGAGASAQCEFAAAQARTGLDFSGRATFKRGLKVELGIGAFADASAGFSKFVHASIEGTAFARAKAGLQLQLPLNLFDEFGFSARAEAIAEAAAGIEANIGLLVGDFVLLAQRDNALVGLPLEMLLLLLEEVNIGGAFEVNVSASVKAHASISVSGTVIEKGGEKAGFFYTVDAGVGLAAGVGIGVKAGAEFKDFRRFYGRAVDKVVDSTLKEIAAVVPKDALLPITGEPIHATLAAFAPLAKTSFRIAFDVGLKIAQNNPGHSKADAAVLCTEAIKTFLEEAQRFIIQTLLEWSMSKIKELLEQSVAGLPAGTWASARPQRKKLAGILLAMPAEPFQDTNENLDYWKSFIDACANLQLALGNPDRNIDDAIAVIYCAYELLMEAVRAKVNKASAYATAVGAGSVSVDRAVFAGAPANQPASPRIKDAINRTIQGNRSRFSYGDLLQCLIDYALANDVARTAPGLSRFLQVCAGNFQQAERQVLVLLLQNASCFDVLDDTATSADPQQLLTLIRDAIDIFVTDILKTQMLPVVEEHVSDVAVRLYVREVLYEALLYVKDVALDSLLRWDKSTFSNNDFTESLAAVMLLLLGRTVVLVGDTFITVAQENAETVCTALADDLRDYVMHPDHHRDRLAPIASAGDPDAIRLLADCVEVAGRVLGPLPNDTRQRLRHLLYQSFEPIPAGREQDLLESLSDQFFIPNLEELRALTNELTGIAKDRFAKFVKEFIVHIGDYVLAKLEDAIRQVIDLVLEWERQVGQSLLELADELRRLEETLHDLNAALIQAMIKATARLRDFFETLASSSLRSKLRGDIGDKLVSKALNVLEENDLYKALPAEFKVGVRSSADAVIDGLLESPLLDPIFASIASLSDQLGELLPDMRQFDPDRNLPEQLLDLVLDKIEDNIRQRFGTTSPAITPTLHFSYQVWELRDWRWRLVTHTVHIPLGRIELDVGVLLDLVRDSIDALDFFHDALNQACFNLGRALAKEVELAAAQLLHQDKSASRTDMDRVNREHDNGPRKIIVLSPSSLSNYEETIPVKIHFAGVPMSFLGLGRYESQRVLIYLNGQLVPPKSLITESLGGAAISDGKRYDFARLFTVADGRIRNAFDANSGIIRTSAATILTDTGKQYPQHRPNFARASSVPVNVLTGASLRETVTARVVSESGAKGSIVAAPATTILTQPGLRAVTNHAIVNLAPGRKLTTSDMNRIVGESHAGILVQFDIKPDHPALAEGVNVLTVVVIERGGSRHQSNVSFTVTRSPERGARGRGIVAVFDPKTGTSVRQAITLSSTGLASVERARLASIYKLGDADAMEHATTPPQKREARLQPAARAAYTARARAPFVKKEVLDVRTREGRVVATHELSYHSNAQRIARIRELELDARGLVDQMHRIETRSVTYRSEVRATTADGEERLIHLDLRPSSVLRDAQRELIEQQRDLHAVGDSYIEIATRKLNLTTPNQEKRVDDVVNAAREYVAAEAQSVLEELAIRHRTSETSDQT